jgi:hypothetical protein
VIGGLIILVPIVTGALASLVVRLDDIKLAVLGVLTFAVENTLVLGSVIVVTVADTIAAAADLGGRVLGIIAGLVDQVLASATTVIEAAVKAIFAAIRLLGTGLKTTVDALLPWMVGVIGYVLNVLGDTSVFRFMYHLADILPRVLPAIAEIKGTPLSKDALDELKKMTPGMPPPAAPGAAPELPKMADFGAAFDKAGVKDFTDSLHAAGATLRAETHRSLGASQGALEDIGKTVRSRISAGGGYREDLDRHLVNIKADSKVLASTLEDARKKAAAAPRSGLTEVAEAYETWLRKGGMATLMQSIDKELARSPRLLEAVGAATTGASAYRATVEIDAVVVELNPQGERVRELLDHGAAPSPIAAWRSWVQEIEERGGTIEDPGFASAYQAYQ